MENPTHLLINPAKEVPGGDLRPRLVRGQDVAGKVDKVAPDVRGVVAGQLALGAGSVIEQQLLDVGVGNADPSDTCRTNFRYEKAAFLSHLRIENFQNTNMLCCRYI